MRMLTSRGRSGFMVQRWLPHSRQKLFSHPSAGCHDTTSSAPSVTRNDPGTIAGVAENAEPD
jgi:hypothetical protein